MYFYNYELLTKMFFICKSILESLGWNLVSRCEVMEVKKWGSEHPGCSPQAANS